MLIPEQISSVAADAVAVPWVPGKQTVRVLHVVNGEHYSGAERVQDLLALRLPECGYDVSFACLKPGMFATHREAQQSPLRETPSRGRWDIRPAWQIAQWLRDEGIALVHSHTPRSAMIAALAAKKARLPFIHHVHSPTDHDSTRRLQNWVNTAVERRSLRSAARVITVAKSLQSFAARMGVPAGALAVVHNGIRPFGPLSVRPAPSGEWTLVMVALFRPRKGLEVLLEAMSQLIAQGKPCPRLQAVGRFETTEYENEIKALALRLGLADRICWRGFQRDVSAELKQADLMVLPSLFGEGLPMVVLEAMAAGVPVIATDVEGTPEAIRDAVDGRIVPPQDAAALASAIWQFQSGQINWHACREMAHRRQAEQFSDRSMAEGVSRVYDEVLGR